MIGLVLAAAVATAPMASPPSQPVEPATTQAAATASDIAAPSPAGRHRRHKHQPVPRAAIQLGVGLGVLLAVLVHLVRRPRAEVRLVTAVRDATRLTVGAWRHVPGPLLLFVIGGAGMEILNTAPFPGGWMLVLVLAPLFLLALYVLPGAVYRLAYRPILPAGSDFRLGPFGMQFGSPEGRAFGAVLILAIGLLPLFLAASAISIALTPLTERAFLTLQAQPSLEPWLSGLRSPVKREVDYALFGLFTQITGSRLVTFAPSAAAGLPMNLWRSWRTTAGSWAPISILFGLMGAVWWVSLYLGSLAAGALGRIQPPALAWGWALLVNALSATYFAFQIALSIAIFLKLTNLPEARGAAVRRPEGAGS